VLSTLLHCVPKRHPDIIDRNLWTGYQILIILAERYNWLSNDNSIPTSPDCVLIHCLEKSEHTK